MIEWFLLPSVFVGIVIAGLTLFYFKIIKVGLVENSSPYEDVLDNIFEDSPEKEQESCISEPILTLAKMFQENPRDFTLSEVEGDFGVQTTNDGMCVRRYKSKCYLLKHKAGFELKALVCGNKVYELSHEGFSCTDDEESHLDKVIGEYYRERRKRYLAALHIMQKRKAKYARQRALKQLTGED